MKPSQALKIWLIDQPIGAGRAACPECQYQTTRPALSWSKSVHQASVTCHKCGAWYRAGNGTDNRTGTHAGLDNLAVRSSITYNPTSLPRDALSDNFAPWAAAWLVRCHIKPSDGYNQRLYAWYSEAQRLYIQYRDKDGLDNGYALRRDANAFGPKYLSSRDASYHMRVYPNSPVLVLVEDATSCNVLYNAGWSAAAMLTTKPKPALLKLLDSYRTVVVWADDDAGGTATLRYFTNTLPIQMYEVKCISQQPEPKTLTVAQISQTITEALMQRVHTA